MDPLKAAAAQESKLHFLDYWRIIRIRKTIIVAVFLLVVLTATIVTWILPESYMSSAKMIIDRDRSDISELTDQRSNAGTYDPYFIQTQFELIQSETILDKVIESLDLNTRWGRKYAGGEKLKTTESRMLLRRIIDLRPIRSTMMIEVRVFSENKQEAADIANEIAKTYKDYRQSLRSEMSNNSIKALNEEYERHAATVRKVQDELDILRRDLKIPDLEASATSPSPLIDAVALQQLRAQLIEYRAQYAKEEELLSRLRPMRREDLRRVIPTAAPDPLLQQSLTDLATADYKLVTLKKDFGSEHPEVQRAAALVEKLNQDVDERVNGIMVGLEARVGATKAWVDKLQTELDSTRESEIKRVAESTPYWDKKRELEQLLKLGTTIKAKIALERVDVSLPKNSVVQIVEWAEPGMKPVRPNKTVNIALGIIVGLIVGVGLAFFIEYLDTSVKTIDDVERALQAPVLGVIPQNVGLLMDEGHESPHAEAYRVLRTNLLFSRKDDKLNTVCVVSAGAGEGKSTTILNLATVFAQAGQRVVVVDSDLRRPTLHKMFKVTNNLGLTNYLLKQNTLEEVIQKTPVPTLDFLASGKLPSSSLGILSSGAMKDLIHELKARYDVVFFDSPPIMGVSDASILASEVDMTLQVIQYRRYPQPMNIRAKQLIEKVGGNLVGIVLNNINMSQDESYYYYSGYYHEYYSRSEDSEVAGEKSSKGQRARLEIK